MAEALTPADWAFASPATLALWPQPLSRMAAATVAIRDWVICFFIRSSSGRGAFWGTR
ncbi:hypothetical protein D3C86_1996230 [compost metagenome]